MALCKKKGWVSVDWDLHDFQFSNFMGFFLAFLLFIFFPLWHTLSLFSLLYLSLLFCPHFCDIRQNQPSCLCIVTLTLTENSLSHWPWVKLVVLQPTTITYYAALGWAWANTKRSGVKCCSVNAKVLHQLYCDKCLRSPLIHQAQTSHWSLFGCSLTATSLRWKKHTAGRTNTQRSTRFAQRERARAKINVE